MSVSSRRMRRGQETHISPPSQSSCWRLSPTKDLRVRVLTHLFPTTEIQRGFLLLRDKAKGKKRKGEWSWLCSRRPRRQCTCPGGHTRHLASRDGLWAASESIGVSPPLLCALARRVPKVSGEPERPFLGCRDAQKCSPT